MSKITVVPEIVETIEETVPETTNSKAAKLKKFVTNPNFIRATAYAIGGAVTAVLIVKMNSDEETNEDN